MRNFIAIAILFCSFMVIGCSQSSKPTIKEEVNASVEKPRGQVVSGDPKTDAKNFTTLIYNNYEANDVDAVGKIIEEYYDFYKDQPKDKVQAFMMAVKEDWEPLFEKESYNEQKFQDMMMSADKNGNMEKLYHLSL